MERGDASGQTGPLPSEHLAVTEVAELLHVSPRTVARWAAEGRIPYETSPAGKRRFLRTDIEELVRQIRGEG